ncbi:MAG: hypothetical protein IPO27_03680 [Bacteroidetes bacterium]|nr:hypothetical protein [Bacteroidota bacterium]
MKQLLSKLLLVLSICTTAANAQTIENAYTYTQTNFGSTGRSLGMGGGIGAMGGDAAGILVNPAGLAIFRKSEFTFTPQLGSANVKSNFLNNSIDDSRFIFNVSNFAFVFSGYNEKRSRWKGLNFAIAYNRENTFSSNTLAEGVNSKNSLLTSFVDKANGVSSSNFSEINYAFDVGLAYQTYLLNPIAPDTNYYSTVVPNGGMLQTISRDIKGGRGAWSFAFSNNYKDKVMLGGSLDIGTFNFEETYTHTETDKFDSVSVPKESLDIKSFSYSKYKNTTGSSIGATLGILIRPIDWIRFGASVQTPRSYRMNYKDTYSMNADYQEGSYTDSASSVFKYRLISPMRITGSVALIYKSYGLISLDYELVNNKATRFRSGTYSFASENSQIKQKFENSSNIRLGAEYRYDIFAFRGGIAMYSSAVGNSYSNGASDFNAISYSGGLGMRESGYFIDLGYAYTKSKNSQQVYALAEQAPLTSLQDVTHHRVMITLGFKF